MPSQLHRNPPFRAEHLGSLLRTEKLLDTRHAWEAGKAQQADLSSTEDEDIKEIVKAQLDLGYHAITDGEYRRHSMPRRINMSLTPTSTALTDDSVLGIFLARS